MNIPMNAPASHNMYCIAFEILGFVVSQCQKPNAAEQVKYRMRRVENVLTVNTKKSILPVKPICLSNNSTSG